MTATTTGHPAPQHILIPILLAGLIGEAVFEVLALLVAPAVLGTPMIPAMLVGALGGMITGTPLPMPLAWAGHLLAGVAIFPLGYVAFRRLTGIASWPLAGALWAVILWALAQGVFAPLVGRPFMLGFVPYTWASLAVHAAYALTVAAAFDRLSRRAGG